MFELTERNNNDNGFPLNVVNLLQVHRLVLFISAERIKSYSFLFLHPAGFQFRGQAKSTKPTLPAAWGDKLAAIVDSG